MNNLGLMIVTDDLILVGVVDDNTFAGLPSVAFFSHTEMHLVTQIQ